MKNHTNIPTGYKPSPLGPIPQDWEVRTIREISNYKSSSLSWNSLSFVESGYPVYGASGFIGYVNFYEQETNYIGIVKDGAGIGRTMLISSKSSILGTMGYIFPKKDVDHYFLFLLLTCLRFEKYITGSTIPHIYYSDYCLTKLPLPPLPEQKAIADVLSTWDEAIKTTTQLIKAKERRKQYLMQTLLTGKKRLKGFEGDWKKEELSNILDYEQPVKYLTNNITEISESKVPVLTANKAFILGYTDDINGIYNKPPVIIFDDFTTASKYVEFPFKIKSSAIKILTSKKNHNLYFAWARLQLIQTNITEHKRRWISEFESKTLKAPSLTEQTAIAAVLQTADAELQLLNDKLDQLKHQKKGLMQQLLTGKKRLKLKN